MKVKLPPIAYYRIAQAAKELGCEIEHIIHWAAEGKTTLFLALDNADCLVIIRNSMISEQQQYMSEDEHNRMSGAMFKLVSGEFGLSILNLYDIRPNKNGDIPKVFHPFTYGGRTFPMTQLAKASKFWAVGPGFSRQMEFYGAVQMRPFFTDNGYVLNPDVNIEHLQVCIVPVIGAKDFSIPDITISPQDLWLTHESFMKLKSNGNTKKIDINEGVAQSKPRHAPKKHAMICLLVELLTKHDTSFEPLNGRKLSLDISGYTELTDGLAELLQTPGQSAEQLIQMLLVRCAQSGIAFNRFKDKSIHEWVFTSLTNEVLELIHARPHQDEIFLLLSALDKNTMKDWIKKQQF